jgi:hypothetical protein
MIETTSINAGKEFVKIFEELADKVSQLTWPVPVMITDRF